MRDAKRRETEWKKSLEKGESPVGEEKWAQWERATSGGRAKQEAPCHCIWQRSGVTKESPQAWEHRGRGTSQNQATRSRSGSWRNILCCETVDGGGGNEPDPHVSQSDESHAKSRCEQPGLPCAWAGPRATTRVMRSTAGEDPRERVKERVQNGSTHRKVRK